MARFGYEFFGKGDDFELCFAVEQPIRRYFHVVPLWDPPIKQPEIGTKPHRCRKPPIG
jgi:hypothetical protein